QSFNSEKYTKVNLPGTIWYPSDFESINDNSFTKSSFNFFCPKRAVYLLNMYIIYLNAFKIAPKESYLIPNVSCAFWDPHSHSPTFCPDPHSHKSIPQ